MATQTHRNALAFTTIAAACVAAFGLHSCALASTVYVTNCNDSGAGSLRAAVSPLTASNGDTVDMTSLTCSKISLGTGELAITQDNLTLLGPGAEKLRLDGKYLGRAINHQGHGTLAIHDLYVSYGYAYSTDGTARGGCLYSSGHVILRRATVAHCKATSTRQASFGGGIFSADTLALYNSIVRASTASSPYNRALGGGVFAGQRFSMSYSTLSDNNATGSNAIGGGAFSLGGTQVVASTISGNVSSGNAGGISVTPAVAAYGDRYVFNLTNSTISGNHADGLVGGAYSTVLTSVLYSTIAFNTANRGSFNAGGTTIYQAAGLTVFEHNANLSVDLEGVIAAENRYGGAGRENDFNGSNATISATHNAIRVSSSALPGTNIAGVCTQLGPLRDNGGPTRTHALLSGSPAIDQGLAGGVSSFDQRGPGYERNSGNLDLGSFEVQHDETVFNSNFEGCAAL